MGDRSERKRKISSSSSSSGSGSERQADAGDDKKLNPKVLKQAEYDAANAGPSTSRQPDNPQLSSQIKSLLAAHSLTYSKISSCLKPLVPSAPSMSTYPCELQKWELYKAQKIGAAFAGIQPQKNVSHNFMGPTKYHNSGRDLMRVFTEVFEEYHEAMSKLVEENQQAASGGPSAAASGSASGGPSAAASGSASASRGLSAAASGSASGAVSGAAPKTKKLFTPLANALRNRPSQLSSSDDSDYEPQCRPRRRRQTAITEGGKGTLPRTKDNGPAKATERAVDSSDSSSGPAEER